MIGRGSVRLLAALVLSGVLTTTKVQGEPPAPTLLDTATVPSAGSYVQPRFDLPAQKSPPNFLGMSGSPVGTVERGQPYVVLQEKNYPGFSGSQKWIEVAPVAADQANDKAKLNKAWVYYGQDGSDGNFTVCEKSCMEEYIKSLDMTQHEHRT
jgi:hypothetical protein